MLADCVWTSANTHDTKRQLIRTTNESVKLGSEAPLQREKVLEFKNLRVSNGTVPEALATVRWRGVGKHAVFGRSPSLPQAKNEKQVTSPVVMGGGDRLPEKARERETRERSRGDRPAPESPPSQSPDDRTRSEVLH